MSERKKLTPEKCEIPGCGFADYIQRHRILPGSESGTYRFGNVIALCPNHHAYADDNAISRQDLFDIVRNRLLEWLSRGRIVELVYQNAVAFIEAALEQEIPQ